MFNCIGLLEERCGRNSSILFFNDAMLPFRELILHFSKQFNTNSIGVCMVHTTFVKDRVQFTNRNKMIVMLEMRHYGTSG